MSTQKSPLLGKKGAAEIIEIYATVGSIDEVEGRAPKEDKDYFASREEAEVGALDFGMGGRASVESRLALRFADGTVLLLASRSCLPENRAPIVNFAKPTEAQIKTAQREAIDSGKLKKLSPKMKRVLGL